MSLSPIASDAQIPDLSVSKEAGEFSRGWTVLLAGTIGTGLGITGLPFFSFGQFVRPLAQNFGWTRGDISGGVTCLMIGTIINIITDIQVVLMPTPIIMKLSLPLRDKIVLGCLMGMGIL